MAGPDEGGAPPGVNSAMLTSMSRMSSGEPAAAQAAGGAFSVANGVDVNNNMKMGNVDSLITKDSIGSALIGKISEGGGVLGGDIASSLVSVSNEPFGVVVQSDLVGGIGGKGQESLGRAEEAFGVPNAGNLPTTFDPTKGLTKDGGGMSQ